MQWWALPGIHWLIELQILSIYIYIYTQQPATASSLPFNSFFTPVLRKTSMATPLAQMRDAASEDAWKARVFMWKKSPVDSWFTPWFIGFQQSGWWCRIFVASTVCWAWNRCLVFGPDNCWIACGGFLGQSLIWLIQIVFSCRWHHFSYIIIYLRVPGWMHPM